jgi:hypothetical protein
VERQCGDLLGAGNKEGILTNHQSADAQRRQFIALLAGAALFDDLVGATEHLGKSSAWRPFECVQAAAPARQAATPPRLRHSLADDHVGLKLNQFGG